MKLSMDITRWISAGALLAIMCLITAGCGGHPDISSAPSSDSAQTFDDVDELKDESASAEEMEVLESATAAIEENLSQSTPSASGYSAQDYGKNESNGFGGGGFGNMPSTNATAGRSNTKQPVNEPGKPALIVESELESADGSTQATAPEGMNGVKREAGQGGFGDLSQLAGDASAANGKSESRQSPQRMRQGQSGQQGGQPGQAGADASGAISHSGGQQSSQRMQQGAQQGQSTGNTRRGIVPVDEEKTNALSAAMPAESPATPKPQGDRQDRDVAKKAAAESDQLSHPARIRKRWRRSCCS